MKRLVVFTLVAVAAIALTLHHSKRATARTIVKQAPQKLMDARSSRFTVSWTDRATRDHSPTKQVTGVMDYTQERGEVQYPANVTVIYANGAMYVRSPVPWRKEPLWLRYDGGFDDPLDLEDRALRNPIGLLRLLNGVGENVHEVGRDEIGGTPTIHYEGTINLQDVVDHSPQADRGELQALLDVMLEDASGSVPFGLWLDAEGVTHRLRLDQGEGSKIFVNYYDFGTSVDVRTPPTRLILSHDDFLKEVRRHSGD